ncbi:MAG: amino acid adenylation domain-containing protein [Sandaracinaceae bacterium]|nr:amino acid adenylation domain-containing protein [Sandaracinaceae bacterium]
MNEVGTELERAPRGRAEAGRAMAPVEERFWVLHEAAGGAPVCNETILLRLRGRLDEHALRGALDGLVARHAPLRTAYRREGARFVAEARPPTRCPLDHLSLEDHAAPEDGLEEAARTFARVPFDLARPPLVAALLARLGRDDHALVVRVHHIAADGGSFLRVIPAELAAAYAGAPLPALAEEYAAFAEAQRRLLDPERLEPAMAYWRAALDGAPTVLSLPTDRPHPPRPSMEGERIDRWLAPGSVARISEVAEAIGVRAHHVMLAAWALLVARYAEEEEVLVGMPIANRPPGLEAHVGCFIDTLILRIAAPDDYTHGFADVAREARQRIRDARARGALPFGAILDRLEVERDPARAPVYQVMFNYLPFSLADARFAGLEVEARRVSAGVATMDLALDVTEVGGRHRLTLEHASDVFDRAHAARILEHYVFVLEQALEEPARPLARFALVPPEERAQIEQLARGPALATSEGPRTFHGLIFEAARAHPDRIAARLGERTLTYAALEGAACALARRLVSAGIGPGERVALWLADPLECLVALLGVMASGAAYVPIDPSNPDARLRSLLRDATPRVLIARDTPPLHGAVDEVWSPDAPDDAPDVPLPDVDPCACAYVIYTSGSTGRPKGVAIRHENVAWQCAARRARYPVAAERTLAIYSFGFDSCIAPITGTLLCGGTLTFLGPSERQDPRCVRDAIERDAITHLDAVPSMYAALASAPEASRALRSLEMVICGGEALPPALVRQHFEVAPRARLFNEYGPTETTVFATVHECTLEDAGGSVPIGAPVGGAEAWVLDARGRLTPLGHPGELHVGGGGVGAGYLGQPERSRQRFVEQGGDRRYRTGDRVRLAPHGVLEFLGRVDDQLQIRGFRVEPAEVEQALARLPGIAEAVVVALDSEAGRRLVAYVVLRPGAALDASRVRARLGRELPAYMVPSALVALERIPRTSRGKLDKRALPEPVASTEMERVEAQPPEGPLEQTIARHVAQLLGVAAVGRDEGFFTLGGHSLLAIELLERIDRSYGVRVPLAEVFRTPTVAGLAALVRGELTGSALPTLETLRPTGSRAPLLFVGSTHQARLLMPHLEPERPVYGLNLFGLPGDVGEAMTVEWIAERYLDDVRAVRPHGPYALAGYCIDAKVALEMAHRLRAAGEIVEALVVIDGVWLLDDTEVKVREPLSRRFARHVRTLGRRGPALAARKLQRNLVYRGRELRQRAARLESRARGWLGERLPLELEHRLLLAHYFEALDRYEPRPFDGRTVLILAEEWDVNASVGRAPIVRVLEGVHETMFEGAQLGALGALVREALAESEPAGA